MAAGPVLLAAITLGFFGWTASRRSEAEALDAQVASAYESGVASLAAREPQSLSRAVEQFQRAIDLDITFAPAHAGLAMAYSVQAMFYLKSAAEVAPQARQSAWDAMLLDSTSADSHLASAFVKYLFDWDWEGAEEAVRSALAKDENSLEALLLYSRLLRSLGRMEEALGPVGRARGLHDLDLRANVSWARMLADAGQLEESLQAYEGLLERWPEWAYSGLFRGQCYQENDELEEAARIYDGLYRQYKEDNSLHVGYGDLAVFASVFGQVGEVELAEEILDHLLIQREAGEFVASDAIAAVLAGLGRSDEAMDWLSQAHEEREQGIIHLISWQAFDPLRSDPRFQDLEREVFGAYAER